MKLFSVPVVFVFASAISLAAAMGRGHKEPRYEPEPEYKKPHYEPEPEYKEPHYEPEPECYYQRITAKELGFKDPRYYYGAFDEFDFFKAIVKAPKGCLLTPMGSPYEAKAVRELHWKTGGFSYVGIYTRKPTTDKGVWMGLDHSYLPNDYYLWSHGEPQMHPNEIVACLNPAGDLFDITPGGFPFSHVGVKSYSEIGAIYKCCH